VGPAGCLRPANWSQSLCASLFAEFLSRRCLQPKRSNDPATGAEKPGALSREAEFVLVCPAAGCRRVSGLSLTGLADVPRVEAAAENESAGPAAAAAAAVMCEEKCGEAAAVECDVCEIKFCAKCFDDLHGRAAFRNKNHQRLPLGALPAACAEHRNNVQEVMCLDPRCRKLVCVVCAVSAAHAGHKLAPLNEALSVLAAESAALCQTVTAALPALERFSADLASRGGSIAGEVQAARAAATEAFRVLLSDITALRDRALLNIDAAGASVQHRGESAKRVLARIRKLLAAAAAASPDASAGTLALQRAALEHLQTQAALRELQVVVAMAPGRIDETAVTFKMDASRVLRELTTATAMKLPAASLPAATAAVGGTPEVKAPQGAAPPNAAGPFGKCLSAVSLRRPVPQAQSRSRAADSAIVAEGAVKSDLLSLWGEGKMPSRTTLLYRGTRDGFAPNVFHDLCDGKGATLVVIKGAKGGVFGGFTSVPWRTGGTYAADPQAFLFALRGHRAQAGKPLKLLPSVNPGQAIYCGASYCATFGTSSGPGSFDLYMNQQNYCSSVDISKKAYAMVSV
jgi:hypothetical protein